ncbi:MAG: transglutaminase domain-containing protein, partial [Paludibacteraceae bacterium]|nr:transglutaminase domain-containing protein [Paludibacteraceae bacterium]
LVLEYEIMDLLINSRGNHSTILKFLDLQNEQYQHDKIEWRDKIDFRNKISDKVDFLNHLSKKDLRDITIEIINDHFNEESVENYHYYITEEYIRNPRVANEMLTPYRSFFRNEISQEDREKYLNDPMQLVDWVRKNIKIDPQCNLGGAPIQPMGVWHARTADALSRNIFFVALARSLDIPARIDEVTGKVQLVNNNYTFTDINFESKEQTTTPQGKLVATFQPTKTQSDPKYYYHFSISKITDEGRLQLLNYDEGESGMEQGAAWSNLLKNGTNLDCGNYLMVSGSRLANGGVLAEMNFFTIEENQTTTTELVMRQSTDQVQVIGSFNSESLYTKFKTQDDSQLSILSTTGRGYYVIGIIGYGDEPTNHALRDITTVANDFNAWGRPMILLSPSADLANKTFSSDLISTLNTQLTNLNFGIDTNGSIQEQIIREMKLTNASLPIFIIADTFNRVVFCSQGYTIGLGEQLIKTIHQLEE